VVFAFIGGLFGGLSLFIDKQFFGDILNPKVKLEERILKI